MPTLRYQLLGENIPKHITTNLAVDPQTNEVVEVTSGMQLTDSATHLVTSHLRDDVTGEMIEVAKIAKTADPIILEKIKYMTDLSALELIAKHRLCNDQVKVALFSNPAIKQLPEILQNLKAHMKAPVGRHPFFTGTKHSDNQMPVQKENASAAAAIDAYPAK